MDRLDPRGAPLCPAERVKSRIDWPATRRVLSHRRCATELVEARWAASSHAGTRSNTGTPLARSSGSRSLSVANTKRLIDSFDSFSRSRRTWARSQRVSQSETTATPISFGARVGQQLAQHRPVGQVRGWANGLGRAYLLGHQHPGLLQARHGLTWFAGRTSTCGM